MSELFFGVVGVVGVGGMSEFSLVLSETNWESVRK